MLKVLREKEVLALLPRGLHPSEQKPRGMLTWPPPQPYSPKQSTNMLCQNEWLPCWVLFFTSKEEKNGACPHGAYILLTTHSKLATKLTCRLITVYDQQYEENIDYCDKELWSKTIPLVKALRVSEKVQCKPSPEGARSQLWSRKRLLVKAGMYCKGYEMEMMLTISEASVAKKI